MNGHGIIFRSVLERIAYSLLLGTSLLAGFGHAEEPMHAAAPSPLTPAEASRNLLMAKWSAFFRRPPELRLAQPQLNAALEAFLAAPQRRSLALASDTPYQRPDDVYSNGGVLTVTLTVAMSNNTIGTDSVHLRSYNGKLTGPTLHTAPGETLKIKLVNDLPVVPNTGDHNTLHGFNVTNLHTHGLHVSPSGNSDNVLLSVEPQTSVDFEIKIPVNHPCGTFWYHAHQHGSVAAQVSSGMSGAIIIHGGMDAVDGLRDIPKEKDRPFILQQIVYDTDGTIEESNQGDIFGPSDWDRLKRFTTVNGVQLPVIEMRPHEIERWRFIHSGVRQDIDLKLIKADGAGPDVLPMLQIAWDGLPLGKMLSSDNGNLELFPGYRNDVLVQAPDKEGTYLLIDERKDKSMTGQFKNRSYIAKLMIKGPPNPMILPDNATLAGYKLKSLAGLPVNTYRNVVYGINPDPKNPQGVLFQINNASYDDTDPLKLNLNDVDEWTAEASNGIGVPVTHPFHIHVNPFEVFSIVENGKELVQESYWRDTIALKEGQVVKFRTRYDDFDGVFVQHCHILDHEDQGMMKLIQIAKPVALGALLAPENAPEMRFSMAHPAPRLMLPDATGKIHTLDDLQGGRALLFFYKGSTCSHCLEQLAAIKRLVPQFSARKIKLVGISTESTTDLARFAEAGTLPFTLLADPKLEAFKAYKVHSEGPLHGLFLLDKKGNINWQKISLSPTMDIANIVAEADRAEPPIELQIRNTQETTDDYIAWAPVDCQIRLRPESGFTADLSVVLTNEALVPGHGWVKFDKVRVPGETARLEQLQVTLPKDGTWMPFIIAGYYGNPSKRDKDAVIAVHQHDASGQLLGTHALMVRVRKDVSKLDAFEWNEYLNAVSDLHFNQKQYEYFVKIHDLSAKGPGPNQSHLQSAFITWHRAFLLQFERAIQKKFPHVALPYWRLDTVPAIFDPAYLGNNPQGDPYVAFSPTNPLYGWKIRYESLGLLVRGQDVDHTHLPYDPRTDHVALRTEDDVVNSYSDYLNFYASMESDPHDLGHVWVGGLEGRWMSNCKISPSDPVFFLFHCEHDRLYAKWQYRWNRFVSDGRDPIYYDNNSTYEPQTSTVPLGHNLKDTMWPWDETFGPHFPNDPLSLRPGEIFPPFSKSSIPGLWPQADAHPMSATMIDYLGILTPDTELGYAYDNVEYGIQPGPAPILAALNLDAKLAFSRFADPNNSETVRIRAAGGLIRALPAAQRESARRIFQDPAHPISVRKRALQLVMNSDSTEGVSQAMATLSSGGAEDEEGSEAAAHELAFSMHFRTLNSVQQNQAEATLRRATQDRRPKVQRAAIEALTSMRDPIAAEALKHFLSEPKESPFSRAEIVSHLAAIDQSRNAELIRPLLTDREFAVRRAALLALSGDTVSETQRLAILINKQEENDIRIAASQSLMHDAVLFPAAAVQIITADGRNNLRAEAAAGLRVAVTWRADGFTAQALSDLVSKCQPVLAAEPAGEFHDALNMTLNALKMVLRSK